MMMRPNIIDGVVVGRIFSEKTPKYNYTLVKCEYCDSYYPLNTKYTCPNCGGKLSTRALEIALSQFEYY